MSWFKRSSGSSATTSSESRKLHTIIKDLIQLRTELLPEDAKNADGIDQKELKKLDSFQKKQRVLQRHIESATIEANDLDDLIQNQAAIQTIIAKRMSIVNKLHQTILPEFKELQQMFSKSLQKKIRKLPPEKITAREAVLNTLNRCIQDLTARTHRNGQNQSESSDFLFDQIQKYEERVEKRRSERKSNKSKRNEKDGSKDVAANDGTALSNDFISVNVDDNNQEAQVAQLRQQQFEEKVAINWKEQDEILEQIKLGLDELHDLALSHNKILHANGEALQQTEEKMQDNLSKLKPLNRRLQEMLNENGGTARYICVIVLVVFAVAILAYGLNS